MIQVRSVSKSFGTGSGKISVLKEISLEIVRGTFTALVGRSGSGKSTLLNIIAGLDRPDSGDIIISDSSLHSMTLEDLAHFRLKHIGLVFQFFNLLPTLTIKENVLLATYLNGTKRSLGEKYTCEYLEKVGLQHALNRYPHEVSGGEIQRTALARALVNKPQILLADEPTGNLDQDNGEQVLHLFKNLSREENVTLLVVTHDPLIEKDADRVIRLTNGEIAPTCTHA